MLSRRKHLPLSRGSCTAGPGTQTPRLSPGLGSVLASLPRQWLQGASFLSNAHPSVSQIDPAEVRGSLRLAPTGLPAILSQSLCTDGTGLGLLWCWGQGGGCLPETTQPEEEGMPPEGIGNWLPDGRMEARRRGSDGPSSLRKILQRFDFFTHSVPPKFAAFLPSGTSIASPQCTSIWPRPGFHFLMPPLASEQRSECVHAPEKANEVNWFRCSLNFRQEVGPFHITPRV